MEKYYTQTIGTPITNDAGSKFGRVYDVILNVETGKIAGFLVGPVGRTVIAPVDILSWNSALIIHDADDILETEEIHAVSEALKKNIPVMGNKVMTKSGEYLGRVIDFAIHEKMFMMTKIIVAKTFLGLINYERRIIAHKDILEIKKDSITVKDPLRTIPVKVTPKLRVDVAPSA